jgi:Flp pilus assembly protein TadD
MKPNADRHHDAKVLEATVWDLLNKGDVKPAIAACQQLNRQYPAFAPGWHTASQLALKIRNAPVALTAIGRALAIEPDHPEWLLQKAVCLGRLGHIEELRPLVEQLAAGRMQTAYQCSTLAMLMTRLEMRERAIEFYQRAAKLKPGQAQHYYNIAVLQRTLGDTAAAENNFNRSIELNPTDYEAYKIRSELRTQTAEKNHVRALEKLLKRGIDDDRGRVNICYALAKELEDLGESERSFHYLKVGADTRRRFMKYEVERDIQTMSAIRDVYGSGMFDGHIEGDSNTEAIFILGMPRTGTTLVERILASHTQVFAAGELNNFTAQMMALIKATTGPSKAGRDDLVRISAGLDFAKLGQAYINSTRPFTGHTPRFIDKLPLNYLYAGLIHLALPNAKIINLERHPLDTCYSVYKQLFVDAYPFSYQLEELGRYFAAYHGLMEHWRSVMPGVIHTVVYEDLVADVEGTSRQLLEFCGLEWQQQCLRFYQSKEASTTASTVQVRKPVYSSSVGKWRQYREQLAPLIQVLASAGIAVDD